MFLARMTILAIALGGAAGPVQAADTIRGLLHGPKGCSFFDGLGGDGAALHALDADHLLLDYGMLEGGDMSCLFDAEFSLSPKRGKTETLTGTCDSYPGNKVETGSFTLTYRDTKSAVLESDLFDAPVEFSICYWPD